MVGAVATTFARGTATVGSVATLAFCRFGEPSMLWMCERRQAKWPARPLSCTYDVPCPCIC